MGTPTLSVNFSARTVSGSSVSAGQVLVSSGTDFVLASAANRALYGRADGIAVQSSTVGGSAIMVTCGRVDASITGLTPGIASWVRVSTTGTIERVTPSGSDDVCGWAEVNGDVHFMFGFLTAAITAATGGTPAAPNLSVQFDNSGAFGGAANVAIAGGDLCVGVGLGSVASTGQIRYASGSSGYARDSLNTKDVFIYGHSAAIGDGEDVFFGISPAVALGGSNAAQADNVYFGAKKVLDFVVGASPFPIQALFEDPGGGLPGQFHTFGANIVIGGGDSDIGAGKNAIIFFDAVVPTGNPFAGSMALYSTGGRFVYINSAGTIETLVGRATMDTLTNKTYSVNGAGNVLKQNVPHTGDLLVDNGAAFVPVAQGANGTFFGVSGGVVGYFTPSAFTPPTGTGFVTVTAGALDAASLAFPLGVAKGGLGVTTFASAGVLHTASGTAAITSSLIVNADVSASAAIVSTKLVPPGVTTQVIKNTGGAFAADAGHIDDGAGTITVSSASRVGASPATIGQFGASSGSVVLAVRNVANSANLCLFDKSGSDAIFMGLSSGLANQFSVLNCYFGSSMIFGIGLNDALGIDANNVKSNLPIVGNGTAYGVHQDVVIAAPAGGTTTLAASEYKNYVIEVGQAPPGTGVGGVGNVDFPTPAAGASYTKAVYNGLNAGAITLRKAGGGGNTVSLGSGAWAIVMVNAAGVIQIK